jgi:hypothetical protein
MHRCTPGGHLASCSHACTNANHATFLAARPLLSQPCVHLLNTDYEPSGGTKLTCVDENVNSQRNKVGHDLRSTKAIGQLDRSSRFARVSARAATRALGSARHTLSRLSLHMTTLRVKLCTVASSGKPCVGTTLLASVSKWAPPRAIRAAFPLGGFAPRPALALIQGCAAQGRPSRAPARAHCRTNVLPLTVENWRQLRPFFWTRSRLLLRQSRPVAEVMAVSAGSCADLRLNSAARLGKM